MTEYQVPGCWLVTSEAVASTSEAVTSTMEAQSKHDEIQEKMAGRASCGGEKARVAMWDSGKSLEDRDESKKPARGRSEKFSKIAQIVK